MNKVKIPKNWDFKYFEVDGNTTKFVYEDQYHNEHIYINEKPEPELPTYEELQDKCNKQKEVLDKIKEYIKVNMEEYGGDIYLICKEINELLEEIE